MSLKRNKDIQASSDFFRKRSLRTYISPVKLENNTRLYRQVFERYEVSYIYAEFCFFNKKFDEQDWSAQIELKVYEVSEPDFPVELGYTDKTIEISKDENLITFTDNWGRETLGDYWDCGTFRWEAWINGQLVDVYEFYIQDFGVCQEGQNSYFNLYSLRFFESPSIPEPFEKRAYMVDFRQDVTRFLYAELDIENRLPLNEWWGEFFFYFYNDARQLVKSKTILKKIDSFGPNNSVVIEAGLGNDTEVTWVKDNYVAEVWFMGYKVASASFTVGDTERRGSPKVFIPTKPEEKKESIRMENDIEEDELFAELNGMVGLETIRRKLKDYVAFVKYRQLRAEKGIEPMEKLNLNAVFTGNPGTGKTTVARTLGKIYHHLGLLPKDTVFEADRSMLIGRYIGETAPQTLDIIQKARGGILFIDEAYSLARTDDGKDFGREALEVLIKEMSDGPGDLAVVVAGYPKEMDVFLDFNPGLRSRFQNVYEFPDYVPEELVEIAKVKAERKRLSIHPEAMSEINQILTEAYRNRTRTFGNARLVGSIIEEAQLNLGVRIMNHSDPSSLSVEELSTITTKDLEVISLKPGTRLPKIEVNEVMLAETLTELNQLVGIHRVKQEVNDLIKLVRYHKEIDKNILQSFSLHNVFTGNPGTGKTTVARLMARLFKALGILERGHLVECSRESLVAGFVGQTATKTKEKIDEAIGGVLFIDEAYALGSRNNQSADYGHEAIEVILKRMEDDRGRFAVIVAGYTREMQMFLDTNPGLRSRFDNTIHFEDYNTIELCHIADSILMSKGLKADAEAMKILEAYFKHHVENRDQFFGNARFVRKVIEKAARNQLLRMGNTLPAQRTQEMMESILSDDVHEFASTSDALQIKPRLGFSVKN